MRFFRSWSSRNPLLKALAILVSALVWFQVAGEETVAEDCPGADRVHEYAAGLEIVGEAPTEAPIVIRTERRAVPVESRPVRGRGRT